MRLQRVILGLSLALAACADDDEDGPGTLDGGSMDASVVPSVDGGDPLDATSLDAGDTSSCAQYGGRANVEQGIKEYVILELATDCAIGPHLTMLPSSRLARLGDCMAIRAQELLGCPGVKYAGSRSPNGLLCGGTLADAGSGITQRDLNALQRDVANGLRNAGVSPADIALVTPQLIALEGELVEAVVTTPAVQACVSDAGTSVDAGELDAGILL